MSSSCNYWYIDSRIVVHYVHVNCKFLDLVISYGMAVHRYTDVPILIGASLISCMSKYIYIAYISGEIMMVIFRVPMPTPSPSLTIYTLSYPLEILVQFVQYRIQDEFIEILSQLLFKLEEFYYFNEIYFSFF
jgi:hypothetical protein